MGACAILTIVLTSYMFYFFVLFSIIEIDNIAFDIWGKEVVEFRFLEEWYMKSTFGSYKWGGEIQITK